MKLFLHSAGTDNELEYVQMKTKLYYSGITFLFFFIPRVNLLKISLEKKTNVVLVNQDSGDQIILTCGVAS